MDGSKIKIFEILQRGGGSAFGRFCCAGGVGVWSIFQRGGGRRLVDFPAQGGSALTDLAKRGGVGVLLLYKFIGELSAGGVGVAQNEAKRGGGRR